MKKVILSIGGLVLLLFTVGVAQAGFLRVPSDHATLSDAVAAALDDDTIILESGKHYDGTTSVVTQQNLTVVGEPGAYLFAGVNDTNDDNKHVFDVQPGVDGLTVSSIQFRPRSGHGQARVLLRLRGDNDDVSLTHSHVRRFSDAIYCSGDCDNLRVIGNQLRIVDRRDADGEPTGGNAAVTVLNGSSDLCVIDNRMTGPGPNEDRPSETVGVIDFNNDGIRSSNPQILRNNLRMFDTAIFISSTRGHVERNRVRDCDFALVALGQAGFPGVTEPVVNSLINANSAWDGFIGLEIQLGMDNLLLANEIEAETDVLLGPGSMGNLVRRNDVELIVDDGVGNVLEDNDDVDDGDSDDEDDNRRHPRSTTQRAAGTTKLPSATTAATERSRDSAVAGLARFRPTSPD